MIYFDHAASSFPKPERVIAAVNEALTSYAANPGRGSHTLSTNTGQKIYEARVKLARFFGFSQPKRVIFFQNATGAINQVMKGFPFENGDHVLATSFEHNAVRRPLEYIRKKTGIDVTYLKVSESGAFDEQLWTEAITPKTKLIAITHASNLTGMVLPLEEITKLAHAHSIPVFVDASQTAGIIPIHMEKLGIDMMALPGHKGLLGPQGTGVLLVRKGIELEPFVHGGTGSHSQLVDQPEQWPERFESGTVNTPGILGMAAGVEEIESIGIEQIHAHELALTQHFLEGIQSIAGVKVIGSTSVENRVGVVAFELEGADCHEIAMILDMHYEMAVRAGFHCAPLAHEALQTIDRGAVRVSFGYTNTIAEVDALIGAVAEIAAGYGG